MKFHWAEIRLLMSSDLSMYETKFRLTKLMSLVKNSRTVSGSLMSNKAKYRASCITLIRNQMEWSGLKLKRLLKTATPTTDFEVMDAEAPKA